MKKVISGTLFIGLIICFALVSENAFAGVPVDGEFTYGHAFFLDDGINEDNYGNDNDTPTPEDGQDIVMGDSEDHNWLFIKKGYTEMDHIDWVLDVENLGDNDVTEVHFVEAVGNFTGLTWRDYHIELGIGTMEEVETPQGPEWVDNFVPLSQLTGYAGLDFDWQPTEFDIPPMAITLIEVGGGEWDYAPIFNSLNHQPTSLDFYNGLLPSLEGNPHEKDLEELAFIYYSIDFPNLGDEEGYDVTIRQYPTNDVIPEPSTMLLFGIGAMGAGFIRRKKKS